MHLKKISLINFKNIKDGEINFSQNLNCFIGNNGAGKTNILDAIYYLSFCKSLINNTDNMNIRHEQDFFLIQGEYENNDSDDLIHCGYKRGQKKIFKCNKKEYQRLADHIGKIPLIVVAPSDNDLISGASEERRKFIDLLISQYDADYLNSLMRYNRVLLQRNKLLKQFAIARNFSTSNIEIWDEQMVVYGTQIHKKRIEYIEKLKPIFQNYYELISQGNEQVNIEYKSQLEEENFASLLKENHKKDGILQYSSVGTHRDDIIFKLGNYKLKKIASQGQRKTYLVSMRLAQFDFIKKMSKQKPILLLDDIFDKLDATRVEQIMQLVTNNNFGQIFISDTNRGHLDDIVKKLNTNFSIFEVDNGFVKNISNA